MECGGDPAQEPAANPVDQPGEPQPLSLRYHFSERYSPQEDPQKPEVLTQYRVAYRDTVSMVAEKAPGCARSREKSVESIYTERVVKVEKSTLADVVRRYDRVEFKTTVPIRPVKTKRLQGMTILTICEKTDPTRAQLDRWSWLEGRRIQADLPGMLFAGPFDPVAAQAGPGWRYLAGPSARGLGFGWRSARGRRL